MKRTNDILMFLLIGLASIVTIVAVLQRPLDWVLTLGACGFAFLTFAWVGMYFRLKREQPDHALVDATYLNLPIGFGGRRRAGFRNMLALIQFHFKRHRFDPWSLLLIAGLAMLAASLIAYLL
jgi:hypothetical protein